MSGNGEVRLPVTQAISPNRVAKDPEIRGRKLKFLDLLLRLLAIIFCVTALAVMVTAEETESIPIPFPGFKGVYITRSAKYHYSKAFVYLVGATAIGAAYALVQCGLSFIWIERPGGGDALSWTIFLLDQAIAYLLLGAAAASTEVAYLGKHGSKQAAWGKICSYFDRFCNQSGAALIITYLAMLSFAGSSIISAYHLFSSRAQSGMAQFEYHKT